MGRMPFLLRNLCPIRTKARQHPPPLPVIQQQLQLAGMKHPRPFVIKLEAGVAQGGAQQEGQHQQQQQHEEEERCLRQRLAEGGVAAAAPHVDWQAAAFQGMEQARALGEKLQQVQVQLVECQARLSVRLTEAEHKARVAILEAENVRLQAETSRLQSELARCAAEPSQMELHGNRLRDQIASMQQQMQQLLGQIALLVAQPDAARAAGHAAAPAPALPLSQLQQVLNSYKLGRPIHLFVTLF